MYSRVANDAPSSRTDHPERTTRRLCHTPQPTLSSTSAVAGSDRAESPLGSRPPAPRAVDDSTASAAPSHARRKGVQPGIRAASERSGALPARPPQFSSGPSSQYARTAATADGSSRGDDPVEQGERQAGGLTAPVARPHYHAPTERDARTDNLSAWQRLDAIAPIPRTASSTARTQSPYWQMGDAHRATECDAPQIAALTCAFATARALCGAHRPVVA
ncbi:hypothetical protein EXIGLDRAFT_734814 [Exidia glandulosa HHB12029]|uniref:Uncharacterized protein n=1 Tax=Exidia glandulosa HHB12029 TaxID=1314781 RepID=A0A165K4K2_EXIGL|nr:hypothetical protein EXIGLDRAFT_734814 [Exidia glandulosa HHB12029]